LRRRDIGLLFAAVGRRGWGPTKDPVPTSQAACGLQASSGVKHEPLKATRRTSVRSGRSGVRCDCLNGVRCDCPSDVVPVGALDAVACPFEPKQPSARDLARELLAVSEREHGIGGDVDDERLRPYRREWPARHVLVFEQIVFLKCRDVARAPDVTSDEVAHLSLLEGTLRSREYARVCHEVSIAESASDQSTVAERTNWPQAAVGGGRFRSPGVAGEVLIRTSERTRLGKSSAMSWAKAPPADTPTRFATSRR